MNILIYPVLCWKIVNTNQYFEKVWIIKCYSWYWHSSALFQVLGLVCGIMIHDIESNSTEFQQLPYHRILIMLFLELNAPEAILESINLPVRKVSQPSYDPLLWIIWQSFLSSIIINGLYWCQLDFSSSVCLLTLFAVGST